MNEKKGFTVSIDHDDFLEDTPSGVRHMLVLDPEENEVYVFSNVGSGVPAKVWHQRALSLPLPQRVAGEDLRSWCENHSHTIQAVLDAYIGPWWNGSNFVGSWEVDESSVGFAGYVTYRHEHLLLGLKDSLTYDLPVCWGVTEYFASGHDLGGECAEIWMAHEKGATVENLVDDILVDALAGNARLDKTELRSFIENVLRGHDGDYADELIEEGIIGPRNPDALTWIVPPEYQGQIVTTSYAIDEDGQTFWERVFDVSDRTTHYRQIDPDDFDEWEPWNQAPV